MFSSIYEHLFTFEKVFPEKARISTWEPMLIAQGRKKIVHLFVNKYKQGVTKNGHQHHRHRHHAYARAICTNKWECKKKRKKKLNACNDIPWETKEFNFNTSQQNYYTQKWDTKIWKMTFKNYSHHNFLFCCCCCSLFICHFRARIRTDWTNERTKKAVK